MSGIQDIKHINYVYKGTKIGASEAPLSNTHLKKLYNIHLIVHYIMFRSMYMLYFCMHSLYAILHASCSAFFFTLCVPVPNTTNTLPMSSYNF